MIHLVQRDVSVLDAALEALPSGTALVWSPERSLWDCDVVEYTPEPVRLELVREPCGPASGS